MINCVDIYWYLYTFLTLRVYRYITDTLVITTWSFVC